MELFALDADFNVAAFSIPYTNLQWNRRYYGAGEFQLEVPRAVAKVQEWEYVLCKDRPEVGVVQKLEFTNDAGELMLLVSGFFAEQKLNEIVAAPRFICDLSTTEKVMERLWSTYNVLDKKGIVYNPSGFNLGDRTQCDFLGDPLADKLYSICETRGLSWRVEMDDSLTGFKAHMWAGVDRTTSQHDNSTVIFASSFGNLSGESVNFDESAFANVCKVSADDEKLQFEVDLSGGGERCETFLDANSEHPEEGQTQEEFKAALEQEALEKLTDLRPVVEIDVDAIGEGYLRDYDLGDRVTLLMEAAGIETEARIVEVNETVKPEGHIIELGFGTKRISNIERAVKL